MSDHDFREIERERDDRLAEEAGEASSEDARARERERLAKCRATCQEWPHCACEGRLHS